MSESGAPAGFIARIAAVGVVAVVATACHAHAGISIGGQQVVSNTQVETTIAQQFSREAGRQVTVACPNTLGSKVGATESCTAMEPGSSFRHSFTVAVTSLADGQAHFSTSHFVLPR